MRFLPISSKVVCVSAAVFYSAFSVSKCRSGDFSDLTWRNDNDFVRIYRTEVPWIPVELEENRNNTEFMGWISVIGAVFIVACVVGLCCVCCRLCHKPRRQSANTSLMPRAPEAIVVFQTDPSVAAQGRIRNSTTTNNIYGNGVVNFAFRGRLQDPVPYPPVDEGPPEYSTVVSQNSQNPMNNGALFPQASGTKPVETPPPTYVSVAPFQ